MQLRRSSRKATMASTMASTNLAEQRQKLRQEKIQLKLLEEARKREEEERFRVVPQWLVALDGFFDISDEFPASQVVASRTYTLMEPASKTEQESRETPILYTSCEIPKDDQTIEIDTGSINDSSKWNFEPEANNNERQIEYEIHDNASEQQCVVVKKESEEEVIEEISFAEPTPIKKRPIKKLNRQRPTLPAQTDPLTDAINYLNETVSEYDVNVSFESTMYNSTILESEEETDADTTLRSEF